MVLVSCVLWIGSHFTSLSKIHKLETILLLPVFNSFIKLIALDALDPKLNLYGNNWTTFFTFCFRNVYLLHKDFFIYSFKVLNIHNYYVYSIYVGCKMYIPANIYDLRPSQKGHLLHTLFINIVINWLIWLPVIIIEIENFTARGVTHACKPASFPSFVTASKLAGKNNDWTSKDQSTWKRIVTISPYPTRSVYSWLSPKFSPEMCPSLVCREGYL